MFSAKILFENIGDNIIFFLLTLKKYILPLFIIMINCLAVILSLKVSNKKQADKIEKSRINTDFFSILSNKN